MIEVSVVKLGLDSVSNSYVVILQEKGGDRMLPIWIGQPEAESIVMEMNGIKPPRPLTHDLCKRLITGMGASLQRVQITKVQDNTYFAELHLHRGGDIVHIDARPSDSIAIALRFSAPIYAPESLLSTISIEDAAGGTSEEEEPSISAQSQATQEQLRLDAEALKEYLEKMRPEDFGKFNL